MAAGRPDYEVELSGEIGQFGGNGRNALQRIMADIELKYPVFSNFSCPVHIYRQDVSKLPPRLPHVDLAYLDPPYNQHPRTHCARMHREFRRRPS